MKKLHLLFCLAYLVLLACSTKPSENAGGLETMTKDDAFRSSVHSGNFIKLSAGYTYYELANPSSDTILVMVHGFSVPSYIWDSTFNAAAKRGYAALRYDTYGRGYSDNPDAVYGVPMAARQLQELLDSLHITKKISLMGLSYGGTTISVYAAQHPERIKNLIYVDAAGFESIPNPPAGPESVTAEEVDSFMKSDRYAGMAAGQMSDFYDSLPFRGWDKRYADMMRFKGFARAIVSSGKNRSSQENEQRQIAASGIPVFAFWGEHDNVVKLDDIKANLMDRLPKVTLYVLPKAGHLPHMEQAVMFNSILFDQIMCCEH